MNSKEEWEERTKCFVLWAGQSLETGFGVTGWWSSSVAGSDLIVRDLPRKSPLFPKTTAVKGGRIILTVYIRQSNHFDWETNSFLPSVAQYSCKYMGLKISRKVTEPPLWSRSSYMSLWAPRERERRDGKTSIAGEPINRVIQQIHGMLSVCLQHRRTILITGCVFGCPVPHSHYQVWIRVIFQSCVAWITIRIGGLISEPRGW